MIFLRVYHRQSKLGLRFLDSTDGATGQGLLAGVLIGLSQCSHSHSCGDAPTSDATHARHGLALISHDILN